jgi:peptidyl-prolyl cis-trans isomerase A (cyclophilin A)
MKVATFLRAGLGVALLCTAAACSHKASDTQQGADQGSAAIITPTPGAFLERRVEIVTTEGNIIVSLDATHAPNTVANFLGYVDRKFYDGGSFFRAVPGFVIQGGNQRRERPTDVKIDLEAPAQTGLRNTDGAIAMARTMDPNSATSEFYIDLGDQPTLDQPPGYAAFGHVIKGMDVARKISKMPADQQMLFRPVKILKIYRVPNS